jgi:ABC-2 type transport system ATP-binding protein
LAYLEVRGLTKRYGGTVAVDGLSLTAGRGVHGLVGPNGSGKTTTLKSIVGLVVPDAGEIIFDGVDLLSGEGWRLRRLIGYVAEVPVLPGDYRVLELLEELALLEGLSRAEARRAALEALGEVGLRGKAGLRVSGLSKGERKKVYFAQALLQPRELYVFDEPFSGLDPEAVAWARSLIAKLSREAIIVMSSHILRELEELASTVTIIYRGRSLFTGTLEELAKTVEASTAAELRVDQPERALELLRRQGYRARLQAGRLVVELGSREEAAELVSILASGGVKVYESRVRSVSLEEAYMKLVASAGRRQS